jgi:hypothetical protein
MTVNELIQQLSKLNPDTPVQIQYTNSCADWGITKKCTGISTIELGKQYKTHGPDIVIIATNEWDGN